MACVGAQVMAHDKKRTNMVHAACDMGHVELAQMLLDRYKMAVEEEDRKGLTPLARAASKNQVRFSLWSEEIAGCVAAGLVDRIRGAVRPAPCLSGSDVLPQEISGRGMLSRIAWWRH